MVFQLVLVPNVQWDRKLDARLAQAVVSINAFKGVEFGLGFEAGYRKGSQVMDEILWSKEDGYTRRTNNLGGFEGGMTNGQPIVVRGVMKPIPNSLQTTYECGYRDSRTLQGNCGEK